MLASIESIEIDLTYSCNLSCRWCDRLCGTKYVQNDEHLTLDQLHRYISILKPILHPGLPIYLLGGEPTLHPQIFAILDILVAEVLPLIQIPIQIVTNGTGEYVTAVMQKIRAKYATYTRTKVKESIDKPKISQENMQFCFVESKTNQPRYAELTHHPIYRAAQDYPKTLAPVDAYRACHASNKCNRNTLLTPYGIFICSGNSVIIARIFGLDIGFDHLPTVEEAEQQAELLCRYCAIPCKSLNTYITCFEYPFQRRVEDAEATVSPSWQAALDSYSITPKYLTRF